MSLKTLCSKLVGKPLNLDVLLLFDKPTTILSPLCELLDNWGYEDDQGEYQPVYEEFGSVLLLLLAFVYRYNLSASDLGIRSADSFVAKLLANGQLSRPLDELNDQEKMQLDGWIHGLFDTDGGGLADDLLSSCPPQDLYLLIPTLFHNIVLAFSTGHLTEETLKTGIECEFSRVCVWCLHFSYILTFYRPGGTFPRAIPCDGHHVPCQLPLDRPAGRKQGHSKDSAADHKTKSEDVAGVVRHAQHGEKYCCQTPREWAADVPKAESQKPRRRASVAGS